MDHAGNIDNNEAEILKYFASWPEIYCNHNDITHQNVFLFYANFSYILPSFPEYRMKKALGDAAEAFFGEARAQRDDWTTRPDDVHDILATGAALARRKAAEVLNRAQEACGLKGY